MPFRFRLGRQLDGAIGEFKRQTAGAPRTYYPQLRTSVSRSRKRRRRTLFLLVILFAGLAVVWPYPQASPQWKLSQSGHRAALIDSLSQTDPDPYFISNVTQTLSSAGYSLDYYGPSQVTVDLFRGLPLMGYSILMFRTHTATPGAFSTSGQDVVTHQQYTTSQYSFEQLSNQVTEALVRPGDTFFAITPTFVSDETVGVGGFHGAMIIQMGCSTLQARPDLATAYFGRGASAFVGWNGVVSSYYTDVMTENFLASIVHGETISQAVAGASAPDPDWGGQLAYIEPSAVSGQLMINQIAITIVWGLVLLPGLFLARRQGFFDDLRHMFRKKAEGNRA